MFDESAKSKAYVEAIGGSWRAKAVFTRHFNFAYVNDRFGTNTHVRAVHVNDTKNPFI